MNRHRPDPLLRFVEAFFREHLERIRGASCHTTLAYKVTLRLFFVFLAESRRRSVADLRLDDLAVDHVLDFLDYLESDRGNSVTTRNCRLACLRSFFRYLVQRDPTRAEQYQRVLSLSSKKAQSASTSYLEPDEFGLLLRQPDRRTPSGLRDYALLLFLYNTGTRIGEALAMRADEVQLVRPRQVHVHGKACHSYCISSRHRDGT